MVKPIKRKQKETQTSIVGALFIESLAVVVMIGLVFAATDERTDMPTVDELIRPVPMELIAAER